MHIEPGILAAAKLTAAHAGALVLVLAASRPLLSTPRSRCAR